MTWNRLELTLLGSWAVALADEDGTETATITGTEVTRDWDVDTDWITADVSVAYAVIKDVMFIKSISPIIGFRYDSWKTEFDNPRNASAIWTVVAPGDKAEFKQETYAPYFGVKSTIGLPAAQLSGGKLQIGGDLKISAIYGPRVWGDVKYKEEKNLVINRRDKIEGNSSSENS